MNKTVCWAAILPVVCVLCFSRATHAAPAGYDIDLKELPPSAAVSRPRKTVDPRKLEIDLRDLRSELARKAKPQKRPHPVKAKAARTDHGISRNDAGSSRYTVKAGDHIALILVRNYGLTELEARRVMPEVMRLNSIHNPRSVAVGRSLVIPLTVPASKSGAEAERHVQPAVADTHGGAVDKTSAVPASVVNLGYVSACSFAREFLDRFGLLTDPRDKAGGDMAFAAAYADIAAGVVCYPSMAEIITYGRLSAIRGEQLIVINDKDSARQIVENIAAQLGMSYTLSETGLSGQAGPVYTFILVGADKLEKEITLNLNK